MLNKLLTFVSVSQFHVYLPCLGACLAYCLNSVLNIKVLVGAFSVIVKSSRTFI